MQRARAAVTQPHSSLPMAGSSSSSSRGSRGGSRSSSSTAATAARCRAASPQHQQQQQQQPLPPAADQEARIKQLQQAAFEAGFQAGYAQGAQVRVSVALDLSRCSSSQPASAAAAAEAGRERQQEQGDSIARSAVKALVWRAFSTTATVSIALLFVSDLSLSDAAKFGGVEAATKFLLYVAHERLWAAAALL